MSKILTLIGSLGNKLIDLFSKKAKNGEKQQEIEVQKINIFSKGLVYIFVGTFLMCVLASLFPKLAITPYWFEVFDKIINYIVSN
ncbi:MAG: hypothetical protein Q4P79_06985 [Fusobacterium sp.]|nr:hypothetical protein [Fusobacterium sp.]MDO5789194.1 hypothetical protein [Fusobacterium sp.]